MNGPQLSARLNGHSCMATFLNGGSTSWLVDYQLQESIPPAYVAWVADATTLFLLGSKSSKIV
jgi:hypothetical protein